MSNQAHNHRLHRLCARMDGALEATEDKLVLLRLADEWTGAGTKPAFDHSSERKFLAALGVIGVVGLLLINETYTGQTLHLLGVYVTLGAGGIGIFVLGHIIYDNRKIERLADKFWWRAVCLDSGITELDPDWFKKQILGSRFDEFDRGNYSNRIRACQQVTRTMRGKKCSFYCYHYHYIDEIVETVTETDSDGHSTTHTEYSYDHYDRYGVVLKTAVHGVRIGRGNPGFRGQRWDTESADFNRLYTLRVQDAHQATKFLRPTMILTLLELRDRHGGLNLEFDTEGWLCLSFKDGPICDTRRPCGLDEPEAFRRALGRCNEPAGLVAVMQTLGQLGFIPTTEN